MAGNRSITVTLRANVQDFKAQFDAATKAAENTAKATEGSAKQAETAMGRMAQSARENEAAWTTAGTTLTAFGAATLGGLGLATKAAMDWESAWAGVQKTVDGTAPQMAALEQGLRNMARELPASHQEIAAVAEAAGQLGIATPNVLGFTRTMIDLGESTNMSADQAATALARFMNITQTSQQDVGRLGASVVGLGNNFATTESEIVDMSMRLAGAGAQAQLSEGEILGMAAAMSSVGIEAEAGGTAMSTTMKRIGKAVDEGGDSLELFAQVSGMSAEQFATMWETRPAEALTAFVEGLSQTEQMGMSTNAVLTELGITGIRESDALLRLSSATGVLSSAMEMGNAEFEKGTALIEEASKRYETAESRVAMARNAFVDAGISIGSVFLPAVADAADGVAELAGWFADLPAPVHAALGGLAGIAGAASLGAGSFLLLFPRVMDTVSAFKTLADINPRVASGMGKVGRAAGIAGAAFVALGAAAGVAELFSETAISADEMTSKLANLAATAVVTAADIDEMVAVTGTGGASVKDFGYALESVNMGGFMKALDSAGSAFGMFDSDVSLAKEQIASLDQALSTFAMAGTMDHLAETFGAAVDSAKEYGFTAEDVIAQMPGLRTALEPIATELGLTADNTTLAKIAMGEIAPAAAEGAAGATEFAEGMEDVEGSTESATEAVDNMIDSLSGVADAFLGARDAARDYEDALDDANSAAEENGKHWEDGTEAARGNAEAIDELAGSILDNAKAMSDNGEASGEWLRGQREDLIAVAESMGATREEAEAYVNQLGLTPEDIETLIELETEAAREELRLLWDELGYHPPEVPVTADTDPAKGEVELFSGTLGDMPPGHVPVDADTDQAERKVNTFGQKVGETPSGDVAIDADTSAAEEELHVFGSRAGDYSATVIIDADTYYGEDQLRQFQSAVNGAGGTVTINGETLNGEQALAALVQEVNAGQGYVDINGTPVNAEAALLQLTDHINNSGGTVDIDGNKVPAQLKTGEVKKQIDGTEGTVTIDGDNAPANAATDSAKRKADGTTGTIDVNANTGGAESSINSTARNRSSTITASAATWSAENQLNWLARNRTSTITVRTSGAGGGVKAQLAYASGGAVHGPGTGTSDSIPARLSNGEHVLTANEVGVAGGHQAIYSLRQQLLAGAKTLHLATGGGVEGGAVAPVRSSPVAQGMQVQSAQPVDTGAIASAVARAIAGYQPMVQIGDREFVGVMRRAERMGAR